MEALSSLFRLRWSQEPRFTSLPPEIRREFIETRFGNLELLVCTPQHSTASAPPVLFVHGGFGHASVWLEWMTYLHSSNYPGTTYAVSVRGHGASWTPSFLRMYFTTKDTLAEDVVAAANRIRHREGREAVLVGHSSGGGLSQIVLSKGLIHAPALALIAAIPCFGSRRVYQNWMIKLDPWCMIRSVFHLQHPRSPLSSTRLVHGAFFGPDFPIERVPKFESAMSNYESMAWAIGMMRKGFVSVPNIIKNISGWGSGSSRIMVIAGEEDKLMSIQLMKQMAADYREGIEALSRDKKIDLSPSNYSPPPDAIKNIKEQRQGGVTMVIVGGAGHHLQNDVQSDQAAQALESFLLEL